MRVLIIHPEAQFFGGAEKMLLYYLSGLARRREEVEAAVAAAPGSRFYQGIPEGFRRFDVEDDRRFSVRQLARQVRELRRFRSEFRYDLIHAWAARGWELAAVLGAATRTPVAGTLHDHPKSDYISTKRRRLMWWSARWGMKRVVCVSEAVRQGCVAAGFQEKKLEVIWNGLPGGEERESSHPGSPSPRVGGVSLGEAGGEGGEPTSFDGQNPRGAGPKRDARLGYLGVLSEGKGIEGIFEMLDAAWRGGAAGWRMSVAGEAPDEASAEKMRELRGRYEGREWWGRVEWLGWVKEPLTFLRSLDLLLFPSMMFDSFPTVLLEAGCAGTAVLAARVGGVGEIVRDGETGWVFEPRNWAEGGRRLGELLKERELLEKAGEAAEERVRTVFSLDKMVAKYLKLYSHF